MDVKFVTVKRSNVNLVPVVDGQVIALEDSNGFYYDMNSTRYKVSGIQVGSVPSGLGIDGELFIAVGKGYEGVYVWDSITSSYILVANKDTDTYLSIVKDTTLTEAYLLGFNGKEDSKEVRWNNNVYMDLVNSTITATEFVGKAKDSYHSDESNHSLTSDNSKTSDVASKIGTETVGSAITAVYILNGVPTSCNHTIEKDVPSDAVFTDTKYEVFTGATSESEGCTGLVPKPLMSNVECFLKGDGTWSSVEIPDMVGCTSTADGKRGLVPFPIKGKYNSFLKGDGTWASYSAGYGLELVSLTFNLEDSGVTAGSYGPVPNDENMTIYRGEYIPVPHITVDRYGRVTDIKEIMCYVGSGTTPEPEYTSLMSFSQTTDGKNLLVTYDDVSTAAAEFSLTNDGNLLATMRDDNPAYSFNIDEDGHVIAISNTTTETEDSSKDQ